MFVLNRKSQLLSNIATCQISLISNNALSFKYGKIPCTLIILIVRAGNDLFGFIIFVSVKIYMELEVALVTPGGVPGVFNKQVV